MNHYRVPILALFLAAVGVLDASAEDRVSLAGQETEAVIEPREAQQRVARLPALTFDLRVAIECPGETESLTLSIADTFKTLGKEDLESPRSAETSLRVPASQLTLGTGDNFCVRDAAEEATDELAVPGFLTAFASLRCAGQEGPSMHFASAPLQVRLSISRSLLTSALTDTPVWSVTPISSPPGPY